VQGFPAGDFTAFEGLQPKIESGRFRSLVVDHRLMPPAGQAPLTDEAIHRIVCWLDQGAPGP
jgi:hypothetical protein